MISAAERSWHAAPVDDVVAFFRSSATAGLTREEAEKRLASYGPNAVKKENRFRFLKLVWSQLRSSLVFILLVAAGVLLVLDDVPDALMIGIIIILNTVIGVIQEGRASRAFEVLQSHVAKTAHVIRDGVLMEIDARDLVPGDIIEIQAGMSVEADARLIDARQLSMNESALTGEWIGQIKDPKPLLEETPLLDRENMTYAGTLAESGTGRAIVTATGAHTEIGKIAKALDETQDTATPLQKHIAELSRFIGVAIVLVSCALFAIGIMRGEDAREMFFTAVAIAVSAVPEGLPVAVSVILAIGAERILKRGGLLKRLKSAETLGSTGIILTDKTGTLTEGKMEVAHVLPVDDSSESRSRLLFCGLATSNAFIENPGDELKEWRIRGQATDRALLLAATNAGLSKTDDAFLAAHEFVDSAPFDSARRFSSALYKTKTGFRLFVSGAPEAIFERSKMTKKERDRFSALHQEYAANGVRVVACAERSSKLRLDEPENLTFLGLIGIHDPLRIDAQSSLKTAEIAGVRTIIATGDHPLTAQKIARELDVAGGDLQILEGAEIEKVGSDRMRDIDVFARVLPEQKSLIIESWQRDGQVVAMTGDGVNDAPALKRADIGIALGSGTDVAKEAADLILLDNSFSTIVSAIEEGRTIVDNLRKVVTFLLATGFTEMILIGGALFMGLPLPLVPAQILWINLIGEGFFNFAFAFERKEFDVLMRKPSHAGQFFTKEMKVLIGAVGVVSSLLLFGVYLYALDQNLTLQQARTVTFLGLAVSAFFFVFALRSLRRSLWNIHFFSNPYLLVAFGASVLLLVPAFFFPPLVTLLHITDIPTQFLLIVIMLGVADLAIIEAVKYAFIARRVAE